MAGQENQQYTVLYGRLSQEDERAGESNSIQHQRTLLEKYGKNSLDKSRLSAPCWRNTQKKRASRTPSSLRMTATLVRTSSGLHGKRSWR